MDLNLQLKNTIYSLVSLGLLRLEKDGKALIRHKQPDQNHPTYEVKKNEEISPSTGDYFHHKYVYPTDINRIMSNPSAGAELMFYLLGLDLDRE